MVSAVQNVDMSWQLIRAVHPLMSYRGPARRKLNERVDWPVANGVIHNVQACGHHQPLVAQRSVSSLLCKRKVAHACSSLLSTFKRRHAFNVIRDLLDYDSNGPTAVSLPFAWPHFVAQKYFSCQLQMEHNCMRGAHSGLYFALCVTDQWSSEQRTMRPLQTYCQRVSYLRYSVMCHRRMPDLVGTNSGRFPPTMASSGGAVTYSDLHMQPWWVRRWITSSIR